MAPVAKTSAISAGTASAFLDVDASLGGRRWQARLGDEAPAMLLAQRLGVPEVLARILAGRDVAPEEAAQYLMPALKTDMPDPSVLSDMDKAADRTVAAIVSEQPIALFGDYDVDGATSTAILRRYLGSVGVEARIYIPDRFQEGYGPSAAAFQRLATEGARLVITLDCGTRSHAEIASGNAAGLDIIVVDHHLVDTDPPPALAFVNPKKAGDPDALKDLCTAGLAFVFCVGVNRALRAAGWFDGREEPNLLALLDLVALGTVCDVVPLKGLNRTFVAQGLKVMSSSTNLGIKALADVAEIKKIETPYELGFLLGPRINAGGRLADSSLGSRLLTTQEPTEARRIAVELDRLNSERRRIEADVEAKAIEQAEQIQGEQSVLVLAGEGWHAGVVGIVAGRLKDRYRKPVLVLGVDVDDQGQVLAKGSGRSVEGVDLGSAIAEAVEQGLIVRGGGHAMAVGLTALPQQLDALTAFLNNVLARHVANAVSDNLLLIDAVVAAPGITRDLYETLAKAGPYGQANPEPKIAVSPVRVSYAAPVGAAHVRCTLEGVNGGQVRAIAFRAQGSPLGDALLDVSDRWLHCVGNIKADNWGRSNGVQLVLQDAAFV